MIRRFARYLAKTVVDTTIKAVVTILVGSSVVIGALTVLVDGPPQSPGEAAERVGRQVEAMAEGMRTLVAAAVKYLGEP